MTDTVLTAIISGLCVGVPTVVTSIILNNKSQAILNTKYEEHQKFLEYKIQELSDRVEKHNSVVERMALQERETKALWKRIDVLQEKHS